MSSGEPSKSTTITSGPPKVIQTSGREGKKTGPAKNEERRKNEDQVEQVEEYYYAGEGSEDYRVNKLNRLLKGQQSDPATFDQHKSYSNMSVAANVLGVKKKKRLITVPLKKKTAIDRKKETKISVAQDSSPPPTEPTSRVMRSTPPKSEHEEDKSAFVDEVSKPSSPTVTVHKKKSESEDEEGIDDPMELIRIFCAEMTKESEAIAKFFVRRLCETINHLKVQEKLTAMIEENNGKIRVILERIDATINSKSGSVPEMMQEVERIVGEVKSLENPGNIFELICGTNLLGVINDKKFMFIKDFNLGPDERAEALIKLVEEHARSLHSESEQDKKFEQYIIEWKENRRKWLEMEEEPEDEQKRAEYRERRKRIEMANEEQERKMRMEHKQRKALINKYLTFVEPVGNPPDAQPSVTRSFTPPDLDTGDAGCCPCFGKKNAGKRKGTIESKVNGNVEKQLIVSKEYSEKEQLLNYSENMKVDVNEHSGSLKKNNLLNYSKNTKANIREYFVEWSENLKRTKFSNYLANNMKVKENMFVEEVARMFSLNRAVLLQDETNQQEHSTHLRRIIEEAKQMGTDQNILWLPLIAYGQLPLTSDGRPRTVRAEFYFALSITEAEIETAEKQLSDIFVNSDSEKFTVSQKEKDKLTASITTAGNIASTIAASLFQIVANLKIIAVLIGEFGQNGFRPILNPQFNRIYSVNAVDKAPGFIPSYFEHPIWHGNDPYFCPNGWLRFGVDIGMNVEEFEKAYDGWSVAYHGTDSKLAMTILSNGLMASGQGMFKKPDEGAVYMTPSIEYSGNPRYAKVRQMKGKYVQMALQLRVCPNLVFERHVGTLPGAEEKDPDCDPNFSNRLLTWVIKWPPGQMMTQTDGILVYGLMFRVTKKHPGELPENEWWGQLAMYPF